MNQKKRFPDAIFNNIATSKIFSTTQQNGMIPIFRAPPGIIK